MILEGIIKRLHITKMKRSINNICLCIDNNSISLFHFFAFSFAFGFSSRSSSSSSSSRCTSSIIRRHCGKVFFLFLSFRVSILESFFYDLKLLLRLCVVVFIFKFQNLHFVLMLKLLRMMSLYDYIFANFQIFDHYDMACILCALVFVLL